MKYGMSGILHRVRLGQVRKARKSSIIRPPLLSMFIFQNSEKNCQIRGYPGGVRWWTNWLKGLFKRVRLGQVSKAIKSWKSEARGPPIHLWTCFGRKFERTVFERTTSSPLNMVPRLFNLYYVNSFFRCTPACFIGESTILTWNDSFWVELCYCELYCMTLLIDPSIPLLTSHTKYVSLLSF